jgi:hypothetical protein
MEAVGTDEAAAAPGLRTAVEFYISKVDRLQQRRAALELELAALQDELRKASSARDQLSEALEEILAGAPVSPQGEPTLAQSSTDVPGEEIGSDASPASYPDDQRGPSPQARPSAAGSPTRSGSGELMQAVEQILVTAGRPLSVRDITEALGRPTKGKEGRGPLATIRATCKRLVKNHRAVEESVGMFAATKASDPPVKGAA